MVVRIELLVDRHIVPIGNGGTDLRVHVVVKDVAVAKKYIVLGGHGQHKLCFITVGRNLVGCGATYLAKP